MINQKIILSGPHQAELVHDKITHPLVPLLDIAACGICATDRKGFLAPPASMKLPLVPGHEFCGTCRTTGKRVAVWPAISCGRCALCRRGQANLCEDIRLFGLHLDGGYQHHFSLPASLADRAVFVDIPPQLSWNQAAMAEPFGCVIHSLAMVERIPESICIYGAGLMGQLAARLIHHKWPHCQLEVFDPDPVRQGLFEQKHSHELVDLVFLACSNPAAVADGMARLRPGGQMLLFSGLNRDDNPLPLDYNRIHRLEQTLHGSYGCLPADMALALDLMSRRSVVVDDLITRVVHLEQAPAALEKTTNSSEFKTIISIN